MGELYFNDKNSYSDGILTMSSSGNMFTNNFQYTSELLSGGGSEIQHNLTKMTMSIAEISFRDDWDNEDDEVWESYLK